MIGRTASVRCSSASVALAMLLATAFSLPQSDAIGASYEVAAQANGVAVGDLNGDGWPDIVTANRWRDVSAMPPNTPSNTLSVLLNDGTGGFLPATHLDVTVDFDSDEAKAVGIADFNGDGKADIVAAINEGNRILLFLGGGAGGFAAPVKFAVGDGPNTVEIADFNNDGKPDVLTVNDDSSDLTVLLGDGNGGSRPARQRTSASTSVPCS